jgi:hypothetical protein
MGTGSVDIPDVKIYSKRQKIKDQRKKPEQIGFPPLRREVRGGLKDCFASLAMTADVLKICNMQHAPRNNKLLITN